MLGVQFIEEIISTIIMSGRVKGRKPLSAFLIARPESGKTSIVTRAAAGENDRPVAIPVTDVTGVGLQLLCDANPDATHVVINDLTILSSHGNKTQQYLISMLNAMTEEGIHTLYTPSGMKSVSGGVKGIIACTTPGIVADHRRWFNRIGFTTRCIPIFYTYPESLVFKIQDKMLFGFKEANSKPVARVPRVPVEVKMDPKFRDDMLAIVRIKSDEFGEQGIRKSEQFGTFVMAHAILKTWKNPKVSKADIDFLVRALQFMSWCRPATI